MDNAAYREQQLDTFLVLATKAESKEPELCQAIRILVEEARQLKFSLDLATGVGLDVAHARLRPETVDGGQ